MLAVLYQFDVVPGSEDAFVRAWERLTREIRQVEGSQGSRLHRDAHQPSVFYGYAHWSDAATRDRVLAVESLPGDIDALRREMARHLQNVEILFEADVAADLLDT